MRQADKCCECGDFLFSEIDRDTGVCGFCGDRMYENAQARKEWNEYHDEPMPRSEIPNPRPFKKRQDTPTTGEE